ncbi:MAG: acetylglutamate kinase [Spirochaetales bacterium]|jgi:acetylglutamate kinase|nr:acetylglutamate kinase [Spirochaetales bacterium]
MEKPVVVLKIGGRAASVETALKDLVLDMAALKDTFCFFLVHGGGAEVSRVTKIFGLQPVFRDGIRQTSPAEMEIVDMVLAGKMNKYLVRVFQTLGLKAVGLSGSDGGFFTGLSIDPAAGSRTGRVTSVDPRAAFVLAEAGYVPIVASTSMDSSGGALNINADEAALEIARAAGARSLVYLSDIPGILKDGQVIARLDAAGAEKEINAGLITGGMIPKVRSSLEALKSGVGAVVIGEFTQKGDLPRLLSCASGTTLEWKGERHV